MEEEYKVNLEKPFMDLIMEGKEFFWNSRYYTWYWCDHKDELGISLPKFLGLTFDESCRFCAEHNGEDIRHILKARRGMEPL